MPGTSRSVSAKDQVGDGSVRLMPPSEHRFCCPTKVCVWTLQSIKQKSHGIVGSSLQAFRQILQILEREKAQMLKVHALPGSSLLVTPAPLISGFGVLGKLVTGTQTCSCPRAASRISAAMLAFHTRSIWITKQNLLKAHSVCVLWKSKQGNHLWYTPRMFMGCHTVYTNLIQNRDFWCLFQFSLKNRMRMKRVPFEVRGVAWQQIWETDSWGSIPWKNNGEEFILLEIEQSFEKNFFNIQTNSKDMTLLCIQGISCSSMDLLDGVGEVILPLTCSYLHCKVLRTCWKGTGLSQELPSPEAWSL